MTDSQRPYQLMSYVLCYCSLRQINHKYLKQKHAEFQLMKTQIFCNIMPSSWTHGLSDSGYGWNTVIRNDLKPSTWHKVPENLNTQGIIWRLWGGDFSIVKPLIKRPCKFPQHRNAESVWKIDCSYQQHSSRNVKCYTRIRLLKYFTKSVNMDQDGKKQSVDENVTFNK
jgi:hypothetical protein